MVITWFSWKRLEKKDKERSSGADEEGNEQMVAMCLFDGG